MTFDPYGSQPPPGSDPVPPAGGFEPGPDPTGQYGPGQHVPGSYPAEPYGADSYGAGPYGAGPYGAPVDQYPTGQYFPGVQPGNAYPVYPVYPVAQSNGLAVAALVTGIVGFLCFIPAVVAIALGIAGLSASRRTGVGRGMSIAGICLGSAWLVLTVALFTVLRVAA